jgi:hypothetical protein
MKMHAVLTADYYGNPIPSLQGAQVLKLSADESSLDVSVQLKQYADPNIAVHPSPLTLHFIKPIFYYALNLVPFYLEGLFEFTDTEYLKTDKFAKESTGHIHQYIERYLDKNHIGFYFAPITGSTVTVISERVVLE